MTAGGGSESLVSRGSLPGVQNQIFNGQNGKLSMNQSRKLVRPPSRESIQPVITEEAKQPTFTDYYGKEESALAVNPFSSINNSIVPLPIPFRRDLTLGTVSEEMSDGGLMSPALSS